MARFVEVSVSYPIPHNWKWDSIGNYTKIKSGYPFDSEKFSDDPTGRQPLIRIRDILRESTNTFTDECCPEEYIIHAGDILIGMDGDFNVGKWNSDDALLNQRVCYIQSNSNCLLNDYLYYYLPGILKIINNATPSVTVKHLSANTLRKTQIPLPPLAEQQRIVDRIESLFAKLDEAKEKAQAVVDSFETRKAAILHKAFTGELTAKWREEHGVGMESWEVRTLDSVCSSIFDGDHMPPPKAESGIPFLVISNVNTGHLTFENTRFVPQEYYDTLSDTRKPQLGDVLYTLVGSFGIPVVVNSKRPFCFQRHMALLRPIDVSPQFLWYILQTPEMYDKASSIATGTAQLTVPIKGLRAMTIPRPNIAEQVEIVRILDGFFAREQSAKEAAEAVLDQIDLMKKSILARAFRGELGTNDPSEESAVELLRNSIN